MMGGHGLGVACGHIHAFGFFLFPYQRNVCAEGLQGRHALSMLGRTLVLCVCTMFCCLANDDVIVTLGLCGSYSSHFHFHHFSYNL